jgi:dipeptidyl-peptidase-4
MTQLLRSGLAVLSLVCALVCAVDAAEAQSRLKTMPGYDQWAKVAPEIPGSVALGATNPDWASDGRSFDYTLHGQRWRYNVRTGRLGVIDTPPQQTRVIVPGPAATPAEVSYVIARGRGADADVRSPDGLSRAFSRDLNVWVAPLAGGPEKQISTDGSATNRIRNGVGSYVYLEEFGVTSPVWWSPDSTRIAWMRYDESQVEDYFVPLDQTKTNDTVLTEAYPHPGANNPVADLMIYDLRTGVTTRMDVRDGQPFSDDVVGHYVWAAQWTKDGSEILVRRADRRQKTIELAACDPQTGKCRTVVSEQRPNAWASITGTTFLADGKRFLWASERSDYRNLYLYDLSGRLLAQLTNHPFDVMDVLKVDETAGYIWYTARSGDNYMKAQLHRVKLDGTDDRRLTDPAFHHRLVIAPDGKHFIDTEQTHDKPPTVRLMNADGKPIETISRSDTRDFDKLGLKRAELFTFTSADGVTQLHGLLQFPSNFDPKKKYPVLVSVYGGPGSNGASEVFQPANPLTEYGFLLVRMDARTAAGKGRRILDSVYQQLGVAEMDDFAAGIRSLASRPYVDSNRVGIFGTSYGGTVAATVLLRHPDVVQAAVSSSPVTDYRLYDSAYSERYLGLPQTDPDAYDRAAVLTYASQLKGDLLLYFGTADDNVHPKNALHLIRALQSARKSFDVQVGPDKGHTGVDQERMMEFFIDKLILQPRN